MKRRAVILLATMAAALVLASGVATAAVKHGTEGRDTIKGTSHPDVIYGKSGGDTLAGRGEDDALYGGNGGDELYGSSFLYEENFDGNRLVPDGEDKLFAGKGDDCVFGGTRNDILYGGDGNDLIGLLCFEFLSDFGSDAMYGGDGNDVIYAVEPESPPARQQRDFVACGPGEDTVYFRAPDRISDDCERLNPREG